MQTFHRQTRSGDFSKGGGDRGHFRAYKFNISPPPPDTFMHLGVRGNMEAGG